jgi:hypothetical protein
MVAGLAETRSADARRDDHMEESKAAGQQPESENPEPAEVDAEQEEETGQGGKKPGTPPTSGPDIKWEG